MALKELGLWRELGRVVRVAGALSRRGLAGQLNQRFSGLFQHGGIQDQVAMPSVGGFLKCRYSIVRDANGARLGDFEVATVRSHSGEYAG